MPDGVLYLVAFSLYSFELKFELEVWGTSDCYIYIYRQKEYVLVQSSTYFCTKMRFYMPHICHFESCSTCRIESMAVVDTVYRSS